MKLEDRVAKLEKDVKQIKKHLSNWDADWTNFEK